MGIFNSIGKAFFEDVLLKILFRFIIDLDKENFSYVIQLFIIKYKSSDICREVIKRTEKSHESDYIQNIIRHSLYVSKLMGLMGLMKLMN